MSGLWWRTSLGVGPPGNARGEPEQVGRRKGRWVLYRPGRRGTARAEARGGSRAAPAGRKRDSGREAGRGRQLGHGSGTGGGPRRAPTPSENDSGISRGGQGAPRPGQDVGGVAIPPGVAGG